MKKRYFSILALFFALSQFEIVAQGVNILNQHGDVRRTGWNSREKILKTKFINTYSFGKVMSMSVDDQLYAQPLVMTGLAMDSVRNVVFAATVNNTVYAFDADKGKLLWSKNYTPTGQRPPKNTDMTGACGGNYKDFSGNIGIVGTPVIDSVTKTMYFVSRYTNGAGTYAHLLHAIDIVNNGVERAGSPIQITCSIAGTGDGSVNGVLSFEPQKENQRAGLLLLNGTVYIMFAGHCDWTPYHGWILGYDAATLTQKIVYTPTPDGSGGGIWMSGSGPAADELGNLYVSVGNGNVGTPANRSDLTERGESAVKLTPSGNKLLVKSFFTPQNFQALENADLDFGVTQLLLVPNSKLAITGCKDGNIYVMNRDTMGGFNATYDNVKQTINLGSGKTLRSSLSYYKGASKSFFYCWSENAALKAFPFSTTTGIFDAANVVNGNAQGPNGSIGALLSVSSDGSKDGTGILWASHAASGDAIHEVRPGILRAFDANDVTKELWNSGQTATDDIGNFAKFVNPTIANGKVYMATFSNKLVVFGITDTTNAPPVCTSTTNLALNKPSRASTIENAQNTTSNAFDGNGLTTRWSSTFADPQWIYVNLGAKYDLCQVILKWEAALGKDFLIQVSNDSTNWTTIKTVTGNNISYNILPVKGTGQFVRMYGTARGTVYGYSLYEMEVYGSPMKTCLDPTNLTVTGISRTTATLKWNPVPNAISYNIQYKSLNTANYSSTISSVDSLRKATWGCGTDYIFKVQAVCATSTSSFTTDKSFSTAICDPSCGFLPTRWITQDIGEVGIAGAACFSQDTFYLSSTGRDMIANSDEFRFAGYTLNGNGNITGQVVSIDNVNQNNKVGVTFRETLDSNSRYAMMIITKANGAVFQYRAITNGTTTSFTLPNITAPYWVKVVKKGTTYSGYISSDSLVWQQVGPSANLGFGATGNYLTGIGLCAKNNSILSNAVMTHVNEAQDTVTRVVTTVAPPLANSSISYCKGATASFLTATGTGLKWYTLSTGGIGSLNSPLPSTSVVGVTNYYVSQTISTLESPRTLISVLILNNPTSPGVVSPVTYCQNALSSPLSASGTSLKWYSLSVGGIALGNAPLPVTSTSGNSKYYVSQTINTCESPRSLISVVVLSNPTTPGVVSPLNYCQNVIATPLSASGAALKWYTNSIGGIALGSTPVPTTTLVGNSVYYVLQTINTCESPRAAILVKINSKINPQFNSIAPICIGDIAPVLPLVSLNSITGSWFPSIVSNTLPGNYLFTPSLNQCAYTSTVNVAVNSIPNAIVNILGNNSFCQGQSVTLSANTGLGLSYIWKNGNVQIATTSSISISSNGSFLVVVKNGSNCTSTSASTLVTVTAPSTWYLDSDNDGFGEANQSQTSCTQPTGYVSNALDLCPSDPIKSIPGNCGCGFVESNNCVTAIDRPNLAQGWNLYPNPFSSSTTLIKLGAMVEVKVYNLSGNLVYEGKVNSSIEFGSDFEPGIYQVLMTEGTNQRIFKVAKQ